MERLNFFVSIHAPKEKVWETLFSDATYGDWTGVFGEGSYAETDNWKVGSKVRFLAANGDGMASLVADNKPHEYMSFKHLGMFKDGIEDTQSEEAKKWSGAMENYTLEQTDGTTNLKVEMDVTSEHKQYFEETWPKALEKVKTLSEQNH